MGLIESLATTDLLAKLFSDASVLEAMLRFEVALVRVEARLGIVPQAAAEKITAAAELEFFEAEAISRDGLRVGTPVIPLVKALRQRVHADDPAAASFVHWGATSQDVADTALVLLLKQAQATFDSDLSRLEESLQRLAEKHADKVMLGRTLLQAAPPVTFGLKAAGWLGTIRRSHRKLNESLADALILQFGGASGTLAFLGEKGIVVGQALADELELTYPDAPWHAHRDRLAALMGACGVLTGALGKIARDISLLMQNEIGEVAEGRDDGGGGSSTMPHKHNPVGCVLTLAAANRVPGLVAAFLSAMIQEHERGAGGWQAEWPTVAAIIQATGLAISSMAEVAEALTVDSVRMRSNLDGARGVVFTEKAMLLLAPQFGREAAHRLLEKASLEAVSSGRHLSEVLGEMDEVKGHLDSKALDDLENPDLYLGVAEEFRTRLLASLSPDSRSKKE